MFILLDEDFRHLPCQKIFLTLNNKFDKIWNTAAVGKSRWVSWHFRGQTGKKNTKKPRRPNMQYLGRD